MTIRPYLPSDLEAIARIHRESGLDYQLPTLDSPLFLSKLLVERETGVTTMLAGRIDVETYLISSGTPAEKWEDIRTLQSAFLADLWRQGIDTAYCSVPAEVDRHFAKRMRSLGWESQRKGWRNWYRMTASD